MAGSFQLEMILNRRVRALNGRVIGRLEEVAAESTDGECFITEYHIGTFALFERLAAWPLGRSILRSFGFRKKGGGYRVPWNQLDLSDPQRPALRCSVEELEPIDD